MMRVNGHFNGGDDETGKRILRQMVKQRTASVDQGTQSTAARRAWEQARAMAKVWSPAARMAMRDPVRGAHAEAMIDLTFDLFGRGAIAGEAIDEGELGALEELGEALSKVMGKAGVVARATGDGGEQWLKSHALVMAAAQVDFVGPTRSWADTAKQTRRAQPQPRATHNPRRPPSQRNSTSGGASAAAARQQEMDEAVKTGKRTRVHIKGADVAGYDRRSIRRFLGIGRDSSVFFKHKQYVQVDVKAPDEAKRISALLADMGWKVALECGGVQSAASPSPETPHSADAAAEGPHAAQPSSTGQAAPTPKPAGAARQSPEGQPPEPAKASQQPACPGKRKPHGKEEQEDATCGAGVTPGDATAAEDGEDALSVEDDEEDGADAGPAPSKRCCKRPEGAAAGSP